MARLLLLTCATPLLLTLAAAPFGLFPLAWVALIPLLLVSGRAGTRRRALAVGWFAGTLYFLANLWWLWTATIPGMAVLVAYFGAYWGLAAAALQSTHWFREESSSTNAESVKTAPFRTATMLQRATLISAGWVAAEWLRCHVASGFPWLPLGVTQTPLPVVCQVADLGGPWIISFWIVLVNALVALALNFPSGASSAQVRRCYTTTAAAIFMTFAAVVGYGLYRLQTTVALAGPSVMVLQSNFPHLRGGAPTATEEQVVAYFLRELDTQLGRRQVDLAVLPESALPPINAEARLELAPSVVGPRLQLIYERLAEIARRHRTSILVGGTAVTDWVRDGSARVGREIRNSVYYVDGSAEEPESCSPLSDLPRYDKTFLVPFSEAAPLEWAPSSLRRLALLIAASRAVQPMTAGDLASLRSFPLQWRVGGNHSELNDPSAGRSAPDEAATTAVLTPICLEAISPRAIRQLLDVANQTGPPVGLIATVSNDGWFASQEKSQHFQHVVLRAIENRLPIARSANTGVSGLIDSAGRVIAATAANTVGTATAELTLDGRSTPYQRFGDAFAYVCIGVTLTAGLIARLRSLRPS
jgi:apolipoprotein N-acyltransferase